MGPVASWMGGSRINSTAEDEWVEMIASLVYYARNTRNLRFGLLSPMNEPDWDGIEGPQVDQEQYGHLMRKLSQKLDALGLSPIGFVGPDTASADAGVNTYFPVMMADATLMAKLAHFGLHNYAGYTAGAEQAIRSSASPGKHFWMTEVSNIWDALPEIAQGAVATLVWDAYDSVYNHAIQAGRGTTPPNDAGNGPALLAYDPGTGTYTPRQAFHEHVQLFTCVAPGARRIAALSTHADLMALAFHHPATNQITIVGRHTGSGSLTISGSLANLPAVSTLQFYLTDGSVNAQRMADVPVSANTFTVTVTGGSTFTLTTASIALPPDSLAPTPSTGLTVAPIFTAAGAPGEIRASWVAPTTNGDGTLLTDLAGYWLYYGQQSGAYTAREAAGDQPTYTLSSLESGRTDYVNVTAYDAAGNESDAADEALVSLPPNCLQTGASLLWERVSSEGAGLHGVTLILRGPHNCAALTTTNGIGLYRFSHLGFGVYTLAPEAEACIFTPPHHTVEINGRFDWALLRASCF